MAAILGRRDLPKPVEVLEGDPGLTMSRHCPNCRRLQALLARGDRFRGELHEVASKKPIRLLHRSLRRKALGVSEPTDEWSQFIASKTFAALVFVVLVGSGAISTLVAFVYDVVVGPPGCSSCSEESSRPGE